MSEKKRGRPSKNAIQSLKLSAEDIALLSTEELKALEADANAEADEEHREEVKARVKATLKAARRRELSGTGEDEPSRHIMLDLAPHSNSITLDGRVYFHGSTYHVSENVYKTLIEIQARGWDHENEVGNANQKSYRRPREIMISPNDVNVAASALMRV